ncbi:hypothetical protein ACHAQH_004757 [Verticillium albo-atrum]
MSPCHPIGRPNLYGLGIRLSFYLQWFGAMAAEYIEIAYMRDIRLLGLLLSAAALMGLVVQLSMSNLAPVDVYVILLLVTGLYLPLAPLWLWKAVTCCHARWDPLRWSRETRSPALKGLDFSLLLALAGFGTWIWTEYIPGNECSAKQAGFFFAPVSLGNRPFGAFHAILYIFIILLCTGIMLVKVGWTITIWEERRRRRKTRRLHIAMIQDLKVFSTLTVLATLTAAVELTITWNHIPGVNNISDAAQIIPLLLTIGFIVREIFLHFVRAGTASEAASGSRSGGGTSRRSSVTESRQSSGMRHSGSRGPDSPGLPPPVHFE